MACKACEERRRALQAKAKKLNMAVKAMIAKRKAKKGEK